MNESFLVLVIRELIFVGLFHFASISWIGRESTSGKEQVRSVRRLHSWNSRQIVLPPFLLGSSSRPLPSFHIVGYPDLFVPSFSLQLFSPPRHRCFENSSVCISAGWFWARYYFSAFPPLSTSCSHSLTFWRDSYIHNLQYERARHSAASKGVSS